MEHGIGASYAQRVCPDGGGGAPFIVRLGFKLFEAAAAGVSLDEDVAVASAVPDALAEAAEAVLKDPDPNIRY